jgi:hypothetical protein
VPRCRGERATCRCAPAARELMRALALLQAREGARAQALAPHPMHRAPVRPLVPRPTLRAPRPAPRAPRPAPRAPRGRAVRGRRAGREAATSSRRGRGAPGSTRSSTCTGGRSATASLRPPSRGAPAALPAACARRRLDAGGERGGRGRGGAQVGAFQLQILPGAHGDPRALPAGLPGAAGLGWRAARRRPWHPRRAGRGRARHVGSGARVGAAGGGAVVGGGLRQRQWLQRQWLTNSRRPRGGRRRRRRAGIARAGGAGACAGVGALVRRARDGNGSTARAPRAAPASGLPCPASGQRRARAQR